MAVEYNPSIVTNGLILCLDAANYKSYPGSGTAWTDLSLSRNTLTLINGPTYNSANGGSISFDGTNDYGEISTRNTNLEFQPTQPFSVFCWFKNVTTGSSILSNMEDSGSYQGWDIWKNSAGSITMHLISSWNANAIKAGIALTFSSSWQYFGFTYDGSCPTTTNATLSSLDFYVNGALNTSGKQVIDTDGFNTSSETITYNSNQRFRLASRWLSSTPSNISNAEFGVVQIYNRKLNAEEIVQNYNSLKGRYGL